LNVVPIVSAENNFKSGLEALVDQDFVVATMHFRRAMDIEHQRRVTQPDMRYLSYYGLCRAKAHGKIQEGLHACKRAVRMRSRDPEMYLNLGRIHLQARQPRSAFEAFRRGLEVEPEHSVLRLEFTRLEKRLPAKFTRASTPASQAGFFSRVRAAWSRPAEFSR
jgi:Tfp pilus assembly protein PilF